MIYLIPQAVDRAAGRHPDGGALRFGGETLTWAELAMRSNGLARVLGKLGVVRGDRVGILLKKSNELGVAVHGVMKAGAAYVPLDVQAPPDRIRSVIRDCGLRHVVTHEAARGVLERVMGSENGGGGDGLDGVVGLEAGGSVAGGGERVSWNDVLGMGTSDVPDVGLVEQDLAYLMYTSGSTGRPKGMMHTHRSGLAYARWAASEYGLGSGDRVSNHAPLHFDLSTFDFFAAALAGATTVIVPEACMVLPAAYSEWIERERITVFFTVPFALIQLLTRGVLERRDWTALRWIIFGGEPFAPKHLRTLMERLPGVRFSNMYGPAEVNGVTRFEVRAGALAGDDPVPIGRLCPNVEGRVTDVEGREVASGEPGELWIRSSTMMEGYWGRGDLNAAAFVVEEPAPGYRKVYFRTGDLVRELPSGDLLFLGRGDRQVKTRGYRVELDEVEAALAANPLVEEAAVYATPHPEMGQRIEGAVRLRGGVRVGVADLMSDLRGRLPAYALPLDVRIADSFPRTTSGKIDRTALRAAAIRRLNEGDPGDR